MSKANATPLVKDYETKTFSKSIFGFWVYIMTDCILFASLFATYAVLHKDIANGPVVNKYLIFIMF